MMDKQSKHFADKCGVPYKSAHWYGGHFNIKDPRCREIIREKYKIDTLAIAENLRPVTKHLWESYCFEPAVKGTGKTIAEAEIACLEAIYEAEKDE